MWSVEHHEIADAAPVAQVRRGLLELYPCPALFETGAGFVPVCDQCETLIQAPVPAQIIDKGIPTAGLLARQIR